MFLSKIPGIILLHRKILDCVTINILSNWHKSNLSLHRVIGHGTVGT